MRVLPQECDGVDDWESEYAELTLVNTVLADFCRYHGLSVASTQLKHGQKCLHPSQVLQRVRLSCQHVQEENFHCQQLGPTCCLVGAQCKHSTFCTAPECNFQHYGCFSCMVESWAGMCERSISLRKRMVSICTDSGQV